MAKQVKKFIVLICAFVLVGAFSTQAHAQTYTTYEGNPSNTYIQYFRDIVSGLDLNKNYVLFRSSQNTYTMVTGDIVYNENLFTSDTECIVYTIDNGSSYNSYSTYTVTSIDSFVLDTSNKIVYSDVGDFPQLEERGAKYEILTAILIGSIICGYAIRCIFYHRPR